MFTEDFLDIVVNVQWGGGLYALVWIYAGPTPYQYTGGGPASLKVDGGGSVPFKPTVTAVASGASVVYRRVFINTAFPVQHFTCDYPPAGIAVLADTVIGTVPGSEAVTLHTIQITDPATYQLMTVPIVLPDNHTTFHGAPFPGGCSGTIFEPSTGHTGVNLFSGFYREGPDLPAPGTSYPLHQVTQVQTYKRFAVDNVKADFEAVFLVKLPAQKTATEKAAFTIETGRYISSVAAMIFPQKGISVAPNNRSGSGTFFGRSRGGRVFVPLKWTSGKPPLDPTGRVWPGYGSVYPGNTPFNDVGNASLWTFEVVVEFADAGAVPPQQYDIVVTYDTHLTADPGKGNVMVSDKIVQAFPSFSSTTPGDTGGFGFYVDTYSDVPYGTMFDGRSFPYNPTPGPWDKIDFDVPF